VDDQEIEAEEEEGPMGLSVGDFLFCVKVCQVVMVCPDFKGFPVAFQVVVEEFKSMDNVKKFFIVNVVILFHR
jgi:hypothetical protein